MLRKLLYTNAARAAQSSESDAWKNSFLSLLFPREKNLDFFGKSQFLASVTSLFYPAFHLVVFSYAYVIRCSILSLFNKTKRFSNVLADSGVKNSIQ